LENINSNRGVSLSPCRRLQGVVRDPQGVLNPALALQRYEQLESGE
jgi:hypothetical protein